MKILTPTNGGSEICAICCIPICIITHKFFHIPNKKSPAFAELLSWGWGGGKWAGPEPIYLARSLIKAKIDCRIIKMHSSAAVAMFAQLESSLPFVSTNVLMVPVVMTPNREPMILPTPPVRRVPPITDDAMAVISRPLACCTDQTSCSDSSRCPRWNKEWRTVNRLSALFP